MFPQVPDGAGERPDWERQVPAAGDAGAEGGAGDPPGETRQAQGDPVFSKLTRPLQLQGSTLGNYPGECQPSQKMFETQLWHQIQFQLTPDKVLLTLVLVLVLSLPLTAYSFLFSFFSLYCYSFISLTFALL